MTRFPNGAGVRCGLAPAEGLFLPGCCCASALPAFNAGLLAKQAADRAAAGQAAQRPARITRAARDAGRAVTWRGERGALAAALAAAARPGDVVITLGAGDITRTGPELLALLSASSR